MKYYTVTVVYGEAYWPDLDRVLERAAKRKSGSSGMGFGERDVCFTFKNKPAAERALKRLKKIKHIQKAYLHEDEVA